MQLQKKIDELQYEATEFSAPVSGYNHQAIQSIDLDKDGIDEVIAFLRVDSEKPLNIQILNDDNGEFKVASVIEGNGSDFDSVDYIDMNGDGILELVVGWQISSSLKLMNIYSIKDFQPVQLCSDSYLSYTTIDIDLDGNEEVMLFHPQSSGKLGEAVLYMLMHDGEMTSHTAKMSAFAENISKIHPGLTADKKSAVFVDSSLSAGVITDVFAFSENTLANISMDQALQSSLLTREINVYCSDINGDNIIEVPRPIQLKSQSDTNYYVIEWNSYLLNGSPSKVETTYHNYSDGWYVALPDNLTADTFTISREDSIAGERTVVFSTINAAGTIRDFLKIYSLTGDNREERAEQKGRFIIYTDSDTIYAGSFLKDTDIIDKSFLRNNFRIIRSEWLTNDIKEVTAN